MTNDGRQKGPQGHAEGQHGEKTHERLVEEMESGASGEPQSERHDHDKPGKHRLFEGREQHDEADKNSDKNRLERDIAEHGHDREEFQVRGGAGSKRPG